MLCISVGAPSGCDGRGWVSGGEELLTRDVATPAIFSGLPHGYASALTVGFHQIFTRFDLGAKNNASGSLSTALFHRMNIHLFCTLIW